MAAQYAKRAALGLTVLFVLIAVSFYISSKIPSANDIEVTEIVGYMVSFHPREGHSGTSFSIQVELERGAKGSFHSDQIAVFEEGGAVLLRQAKNLKTGEVNLTFMQRLKFNPNKLNQSGTPQSGAPV